MGKRDVRLVVNRVNPKLYSAMNLTVDDVMDRRLPPAGAGAGGSERTSGSGSRSPTLHYARRSLAAAAFHRMAKAAPGHPCASGGAEIGQRFLEVLMVWSDTMNIAFWHTISGKS